MPRGDKGDPPWGTVPGAGGDIGGRRGRMAGIRPGTGHVGECVCPSCGTTAPHEIGIPCYHQRCPKCGAPMVRK